MREKYSFRTETKTTYTSALSIKSIRSESFDEKVLESLTIHPLQKMVLILQKKMKNKKRYIFQILKQFLLFNESSIDTSVSNVSQYFAVLTGEEKLHSLFKILETQMIETKIWAFLNLRHWKMVRRIAQAAPICNTILEKKQMSYKFQGLYAIRQKANEQPQSLTYQKLLSITIANQTPKKSVKNEGINKSYISRQTQIDSYSSQKSIQNHNNGNDFYLSACCEACCCGSGSACCYNVPCDFRSKSYNLEQRMEYLKMLEELAQQYDIQ